MGFEGKVAINIPNSNLEDLRATVQAIENCSKKVLTAVSFTLQQAKSHTTKKQGDFWQFS